MKRILELFLIIAVIASIGALTSCTPEDDSSTDPDPPAAHDVLRQQVEQERELRATAETQTEDATASADFWRAAAVFLIVGLCAAFIGGTAIGSKGKKHANS